MNNSSEIDRNILTTMISRSIINDSQSSSDLDPSYSHHQPLDISIQQNNTTHDEQKTKKSRSIRKTVSFADTARARRIISLKDFKPSEIQASWYSNEEYKSIQLACVQQIAKMNAGKTLKDKKFCSRGLEGHTKIGSKTKNLIRSQSIFAVLEEQNMQYEEGFMDDVAIAEIYGKLTADSQSEARKMGLLDEQAVRKEIERRLSYRCIDDQDEEFSTISLYPTTENKRKMK